jgi:hypothetical protein
MSRITRDAFIDTMGSRGGLDPASLDPTTQDLLQKAAIGPDTLRVLAGADHVIGTHDELGRLFDLIDRVDHDGRRRSIETTNPGGDGRVLPTASGAIYDALKNHLESVRLGAPSQALHAPKAGDLPSPEACRSSLAAIAAAGFSDVRLSPVPYFNQANPAWSSHPYPKSPPVPGEERSLSKSGCCPTSLAMVDGGLRSSHATPAGVADFAVARGVSGSPKSVGTDTAGLARAWAREHGLEVQVAAAHDQARNVDVLAAGLAANGIALVSVGVDEQTGRGHFTRSGHVVVINGCAIKDGEQWFSVANPGRRDQGVPHRGLLGVDDAVVQVRGAHDGVGRVWISRSQLEAEMKRCYVFRSGDES